MAAPARISSNCCLLLTFTATSSSSSPSKIKSELQRVLPASLIQIQVTHILGRPQVIHDSKERRVIPRDAGANDLRIAANLDALGGDDAIRWKGFGKGAQNAQVAERSVKPGPKPFDLLLIFRHFFDARFNRVPFCPQVGHPQVWNEEGPGKIERPGSDRRSGPGDFPRRGFRRKL